MWDVLVDDHGEPIDSLTHTITDYINLFLENTAPTRTVDTQAVDYSRNKGLLEGE